MKTLIPLVLLGAASLVGAPSAANADATLDAVKARDTVICGVNGNRAGFSALNSRG